ncbi:MAG: ATP-binding protein [Acidobacteriota bacterium]|nr:ATP-binding protein [Acidobacteriota bacterium]
MAGTQGLLFSDAGLSPQVALTLRRHNPWWEGDPMPLQPETRRHLVARVRRLLEAEIAPIVVVSGPRQVGKTTAQFQMIADLLKEGTPAKNILRVQFDELPSLRKTPEPILSISDWFERNIAEDRFNALAQAGHKAYLFFDEVQNIEDWDAQLKSLVDNASVKVVVTGSSALRIEMGRDSLAGRISTVEAGVLSLTEIAALRESETLKPFLRENGLHELTNKGFWQELCEYGQENTGFVKEAFHHFSERGGYPIVHKQKDDEWALLADQLNETVIKRVIQHDLRVGQRGRKRDAQLLEEIFRMACRYAGQTPTVSVLADEARQSLGANVGSQRVNHYLKFLGETLLLRLIPPLEIRLKRKRGSSKLCLVDHGLRASWLQEQIPLTPEALAERPELTTVAGHLAESIFGSVASTIPGLDIAHFPERGTDREVDFILTVGVHRIPVEIKYQRRIDPLRDTLGIRSFLEKAVNNATFGLLVTQDYSGGVDDPRIVSLPLSTFMLIR